MMLADLSLMLDTDDAAHLQYFEWQPSYDGVCAASAMLELYTSGMWAVPN